MDFGPPPQLSQVTLVWVPRSHIGIRGNETPYRLVSTAIESQCIMQDIGLELREAYGSVDAYIDRLDAGGMAGMLENV